MLKIERILISFALVLLGELLSRSSEARDMVGNETQAPESDYNPNIFVEQQTDCMSVQDIRTALSDVLASREESKFMIVTVVVSPGVEKTLAVLRVVERETGEILMERRFGIAPEECANAHLALKAMLEQFLTGFPIEKWRERKAEARRPPPPKIEKVEVVVEKQIVPLSWLLELGVDSRWPVPSGDVEFSLGLDAGGKYRGVYSAIVFRAGWPRPLGEGRYLESTGLLALGLRISPRERLDIRTEIRSGILLINGLGYKENYHQWLIMLELQMSFLWKAGPVKIGPEIAISPLFHSVYTESGNNEDLPWIRVGLLLCIPLGTSLLK